MQDGSIISLAIPTAAITKYREATSISPDFVPAYVKLSWAYEEKQMWNEAADARERFYRAAGYPSVSEQIQRAYVDTGYPGVLNFLLGEAAKARPQAVLQ